MDSKPIIVVSKCLTGEKVRYNGETISDASIVILSEITEIVPFCPEIEANLGVPRNPLILVKKKRRRLIVQEEKTGIDRTELLKNVCESFLSKLHFVDGFVLKSKSPSCGWKSAKIYDANGLEVSRKGRGIFAKSIQRHFRNVPIVEEVDLKLEDKKKNFIVRVFLSSWIRKKTKEDFKSQFDDSILEILKINSHLLLSQNFSDGTAINPRKNEGDLKKTLFTRLSRNAVYRLYSLFEEIYQFNCCSGRGEMLKNNVRNHGRT
ncbi:MAG: DUF523 domain-containing protein [Desulfobacterota bacterium]|nr:DUF523 domain-containing protein [Thermodesulfobacteriota bacterium]MDW8002550.1 DUF523 domain-containing protein [Deltaproteobacteria bacterium]